MPYTETKTDDATAQTINIDELIDSKPIGALQWRVVGLCFMLAMVDGFDMMSMAYVAPAVTGKFSIAPALMGQLLSAALVGLMFGAFLGSPLADRFGRKPVIVASTVIMGVFSLLTALAGSTAELFIYRFLTGLGLGAVMPNINIITAEFSPARRRALMMTIMFVGLPIGAIVGGIATAGLVNSFGWRSVFVLGGILPLVIAPLLLPLLPESPRFLAQKGVRAGELAKIVNGIARDAGATPNTRFVMPVAKTGGAIRPLFSEGRRPVTLLLWVIFFCNLLAINAIVGWLPSVLSAAGFPLDRAILTSLLFNTGGVVGGLMIAITVDRIGAVRTMLAAFLAAAVTVSLVGQMTGSLPLLLVSLFLAGSTAIGCQFGINAMASASYDTGSRATGLGWALTAGRLGAVIGPVVVGAALALALPVSTLFLFGAIPMLIAAGSVFLLSRLKS